MKNKKLLKAIAATIVCSAMGITAFSFAACDPVSPGENGGDPTHYHTYSTGDDWGYDGNYHWRYATCEHTDKIKDKAAHTWENDVCTECKAPRQIIRPTLSEEDEEQPEKNPDGTINVKYDFNASDCEAVTLENDVVSSIYTIKSGSTIRTKTPQTLYEYNDNSGKWEPVKGVPYTKSVKVGSGNDVIEINAPAAGTFVMHVGNGSGTVTSEQLYLTKPGGSQEVISYYGAGSSGPCIAVTISFAEAGKYKITRKAGTSDIYYMSYACSVQDSPVESIGVAATGAANYFVGQEFSAEGLAVNATTETGRIAPIDNGRLLIDYADFNNKKSGTYEILVSYTKAGHTYETSYSVNVFAYDDLTLGTDKIVKSSSNTSSNNGVYENVSVRQLYFTGDTLSTAGLSVILNGSKDAENKDFLLKDSQYKVSEVDMSTAGKKTVTVSYTTGNTTKSKTFNIYVIEKDAALANATSVNVVVNANTADADIGVKNGDNAYQFRTIHQALEFLENSGVAKAAAKTINLAEGKYWEKLEVKVPNLTVIGAGRDKTTIEYDALYGAKDAGGFEHVTDSTATLNVREAAENFTIKGVTLSNKYNTLESYIGAPSTDQRALAVLIQADKVVFEDCSLLGYQDTLELFKGRQYFVNCYISGTTDFIFGTNNTTYFEKCEIHSIYNGSNDGGYITAFKGNNADANDYVTYGAIFDDCHFTADEKVVSKGDTVTNKDGSTYVAESGNTAIGRTWGPYAAVAVINSEIDGHVSTKTSEFKRNDRYVNMSVAPNEATVKFVEYNNTGDGAIDTAVSGMRFLSDDEAKNYSDFATIFGTTNGKVSYTTAWAPIKPGVTSHTVTVKNDKGEALFELSVEDGNAITAAKLAEKLAETAYARYNISGVYSDSECKVEYTYPEISADGEIYLTLEEGPFAENAEFNFSASNPENEVTEGTKYIGKLKIDANSGSFVFHSGGWSKLTGDATMTLKLKADTRVVVTSYDDGLEFTLGGQPVDVAHINGKYTVDVRTAGDLVIKMKAGAPQGVGYVGKVTVTVDVGLSNTQFAVKVNDGTSDVSTFNVYENDKISRAKIDAIKNELTPPAGQAFKGYFSDPECKNAFDFDAPVTAETVIYIGWEAASPYFEENTQISFGSNGKYTNYVGTKLKVEKGEIKPNGGDNCEIGEGTEISIQVKQGTKITVAGYPDYTCYTVKIGDAFYKDEGETGDATVITLTTWIYTATEDCKITFVGGRNSSNKHSNYFYSINVEIPQESAKTYAIGETINFLNYTGAELGSNQTGKFEGVDISTGAGKFSKRTSDIQCGVGTTFTFKVAAGVTADNITVISYQNTPVAAGTWTITVTDGVATVECIGTASNHQYITSIEIKEVTTSNN